MKKLNLIVCFVVGPSLFFSSCQPKVDVEKGKEAIRAVIDAEKKGFFDKNFEAMAATWMRNSSSVKVLMSEEGVIELFGWERISQSDKENISKDLSQYKNIDVKFSDFQYHVYENSAWVLFKARWDWIFEDKPVQIEQARIMAFEKVEGEWKTTLMAIYNVPAKSK